MASRKSTSAVDINSKIGNLESLSLPSGELGTTRLAEGSPMQLSNDGTSFVALGGDTGQLAFVNFVDDNRADAQMLQGDPFQDSLAARDTQGGRLTGIRGNGVVVGIPVWLFDGTPEVGKMVKADAGTVTRNGVDYAAWTCNSSNFSVGTGINFIYGQIERIANGKAYFMFFSLPSISNIT